MFGRALSPLNSQGLLAPRWRKELRRLAENSDPPHTRFLPRRVLTSLLRTLSYNNRGKNTIWIIIRDETGFYGARCRSRGGRSAPVSRHTLRHQAAADDAGFGGEAQDQRPQHVQVHRCRRQRKHVPVRELCLQSRCVPCRLHRCLCGFRGCCSRHSCVYLFFYIYRGFGVAGIWSCP